MRKIAGILLCAALLLCLALPVMAKAKVDVTISNTFLESDDSLLESLCLSLDNTSLSVTALTLTSVIHSVNRNYINVILSFYFFLNLNLIGCRKHNKAELIVLLF